MERVTGWMQALVTMQRMMKVDRWLHPAPLIWLLDCEAALTDAELDDFATYGFGLGPDKVCHAQASACQSL